MSKGAYYQGLVYANRGVKPVNFGALATGVAEQELTKRKDREEFELKIAENYGDVIYPAFDGTGLENADMYQRSVADLISARAEDLNDRFNNKEINKVQYTREMAKLKGQTQQLVSSFGKIEDFVKKVNELGGDADPKTLEMVEELELLFKNAKPYLDENNSLGNFSVDEEGKNVRSFLWSNVNKRLIAEKRYDVNTIPKLILGVQGDLSKFVADEKITSSLLDGSGNLKQEQTDLIGNLVKSMSNSELTSYAEQVLNKGEFSDLDITSVKDKEKLQGLVVTDLTDRTKNFLSQKTTTSEVEAKELNLKIQESYRKQIKFQQEQKDKMVYDYDVYTDPETIVGLGFGTLNEDENAIYPRGYGGDEPSGPLNVEVFTLKKPKVLNFAQTEALSGLEQPKGVVGKVVLQQMFRDSEGNYIVTIGYNERSSVDQDNSEERDETKIDVQGFEDKSGALVTPQTKNIRLTSKQQISYFMAQFPGVDFLPGDETKIDSVDPLQLKK